MEETQNTQIALRIDEMGARYRVSASTIWRYITLGKLRVIRVGGRTIVPPDEVARVDREGLPVVSRAEERAIMQARRSSAA